ncbi:metalloregulator ArsR/SmtB family transcription factor [Galbibacter sp. EGI 63066]|uniref:ArsR/SmtB family transcription factor n=1 Tax=Galbibacter sp. EGI 63066 TaxID=2993559 RepID=UPI00224978A2|nr:metalloregulator ArsR/SmtB family transcription factor [Galbibacter sp. EGI 63066]MCX2679569.1 metalloregulator ArsR/SmtB family transcription factor [Galbibacter sp. EGI 63066]
MGIEDQFSYVASLLGDKARAAMLWSLLDGKAYTATELAVCADISRQSASNHLSKLIDAEFLVVEKQGRHRYYRLANERIAQVIESMASLIPDKQVKTIHTEPKSQKIAYARTCYDHLAGEIAVKITTSLVEQKIIQPIGKEYNITDFGNEWFKELGINTEKLKLKKRSFARKCLDWTERKHHLAGALGAALLETMLEKDWIRKKQNTREVLITPLGMKKINEKFKMNGFL